MTDDTSWYAVGLAPLPASLRVLGAWSPWATECNGLGLHLKEHREVSSLLLCLQVVRIKGFLMLSVIINCYIC